MTDPLTYNAPLGARRAGGLVAQVLAVAPATVVDLGCGRGALLLDVLEAGADAGLGVRGIGIDVDEGALAAAQRAATDRNVADRATFVASDARAWLAEPGTDVDVSISIGASHAFGDLAALLQALPGGRAIVGDGFFARTPDEWCVETFGDLARGTDAVREIVRGNGWRTAEFAVSTPEEWDEFEADWRAGVEASYAAQRKTEYEEHYRGVLGFAWLVLDRS